MRHARFPLAALALALLACSPEARDDDRPDAGTGANDDADPGAGGTDAAGATLPPFDQPGASWTYDIDSTQDYQSTTTVGAPIQLPLGTVYPHTITYSGFSDVTTTLILVEDGEIATVRTTNNAGSLAYDPPLVAYKAGLSPGDSWSQSVTVSDFTSGTATVHTAVVGEETVTVPAGTFTCLRLRVTYGGVLGAFAYDQWWSSTVGSVLYVFDSGGTYTRSELAVAPD
jgi:hypothetical protein